EAFGARALVIDGHDLPAIDSALATGGQIEGEQPTVIIAKTIKGRGFSEGEDKNGWHGKPFPPDMAEPAIAELGGARHLAVPLPLPPGVDATSPPPPTASSSTELPRYTVGEKVATRKAYGDALVTLGARNSRVVALDAEVSNSTFADEFAKAYPE